MKVVKAGLVRGVILALAAAPLGLASHAALASAPSVVIDVASGQVLEAEQPTASWFPASLTKLMTVYVALDAVRQNRISLDTPLLVSPRAVKMAPSKMGFRPGSQVTLKNALIMLMVKSANDIAVTIAEGVSGSVEAFADDMNKASARLGMRESYWVNPNGLPDQRQVTSARDLAVLGRALLTQFPEQAGLFNVGAMQLGNQIIPTHNGLLGRYPGADGMKTGFTCPAGFNLVASATRGGRKLIAVVLGAPSAAARTAKAAALLDRAFSSAGAMGEIDGLQSLGVGQAPDMRDSVCRHRGKATAEFMAEVEDVAIPIGSGAASGVPLLDSLAGGAQQRVSAKQIAHLPRPHFEPVPVFVGPAPGYAGPVARVRAPGAPVGEQPDLAAYSEPQAEARGATPISKAASDAKPLRGHAANAKTTRSAKAAGRTGAEPVIAAGEGASDMGAEKAETPRAKAHAKSSKKRPHKKAGQGVGQGLGQAAGKAKAGHKAAVKPGKPVSGKPAAGHKPAKAQTSAAGAKQQ